MPSRSPRKTLKSILKVKKQPNPRRSPIVPRVPVTPDFDEVISPRSPRYTRRKQRLSKRQPRIRILEDKNQVATIDAIDARLDKIHDLKDPTDRITIARSVSMAAMPNLPIASGNNQKKPKGVFARLFGKK